MPVSCEKFLRDHSDDAEYARKPSIRKFGKQEISKPAANRGNRGAGYSVYLPRETQLILNLYQAEMRSVETLVLLECTSDDIVSVMVGGYSSEP